MGEGSRELVVVVLAAGKGTRMRSGLAKVLHPIAGRPMLAYPLAAAEALAPAQLIAVVGRQAEAVREAFADRARFVTQTEQRGTGHAVLQTQRALEGFRGDLLILNGDTPLLRGETLQSLAACKRETGADLVLLTAAVDVRGIVVRKADGGVERIVEASDATPEELAIEERNTGVYLLDAELLWKTLAQVGDQNQQGEVYLTDIVELCVRDGLRVEALRMADDAEALGVDNRAQLAQAAAALRERKVNELMAAGVTIVDPATTWVDMDVQIGADSLIEPGCVIQGPCKLGERVHVKPGCMLESCEVGDEVVMGPNAHLRPGTVLGRGVRIGNYVEVKNSVLAAGVKADHLSYIGDADVGEGAAFGCGSITVNYDWNAKHRTTVGANARIGCNVNLVAPVEVGSDAAIAAGSTITKDVPDGALAVAREAQRHIKGWTARQGAPAVARKTTAKKKPAARAKAARVKTSTAGRSKPKRSARASAAKAGKNVKSRARKKAPTRKTARKSASRKKR